MITKPPMPAAMSDNSMALVLSFLPNTTYDLPWCDLPLSAGKSYVIFGKTETNAIDLSKLGDKSKYTIDYLGDKNDNIIKSSKPSPLTSPALETDQPL
jgi:hypothetical protein